MSLTKVFDIAGSALSAETMRLRATASNMSNANVEAGSADEVYKAQYPVFKAIQDEAMSAFDGVTNGGVKIDGMYQSEKEPISRYEPNNPLADEKGLVYAPDINYVEEMANMISASRSYQMDLEIMSTTKQMLQRTLQLGD